MARRTKKPRPEDLTDRTCDWPDCAAPAPYKAPRSRDALNSYYHFCLEHVRDYNAKWNYYAGMSEDEVEADRRRDTTWARPTWKLGSNSGGRAGGKSASGDWQDHVHDPFGFMDDEDDGGAAGRADGRANGRAGGQHRANTKQDGLEAKIIEALSVLDLTPPVTAKDLRQRYKQLVKRYHPDVNGGDKTAEEVFKRITAAYETLRETLATFGPRHHMDGT